MLYIFRATVQYTKVFTSNLLLSIYYSLLLNVSATGLVHLQEATKFTDLVIYCICCKWPYPVAVTCT